MTGGITFNVNRDFYNSGVIAENIRDSYNTLSQAAVSEDVRAALDQLHELVGPLINALDAEEAEVVTEDLQALTQEAASSNPRPARLRHALDALTTAATRAATVGMPVVELATKLKELFGV